MGERTARTKEDLTNLIKQLEEHGRHQRPFADTTKSNLDYIEKKWAQFCAAAALGDPTKALRDSTAATIKAFFQWLIWNPERAPQQAPSLKQYFRRLKQAYANVTGRALDDQIVIDVNAYIDHYAEGKKETSPRTKPVPSGADFVQMLHFLYSGDRTRYPDERQRVQQAFLMLVHGYSGARPSTTMRTSRRVAKKDDDVAGEANVKLCYRDFTMIMKKDDHGIIRIGVRTHFTHFKGEKHRAQRKKFTWWDQADILICPVAHLMALALHDGAFNHPQLTTAESILSLTIPGQEKQLVLS